MSQLTRAHIRAWIERTSAESHCTLFETKDRPSLEEQLWRAFDEAYLGSLGAYQELGRLAVYIAASHGYSIEDKAIKTHQSKGSDYTAGASDPLANFYEHLDERAVHKHGKVGPKETWAIFVFKHLMAVVRFLRQGQVESEPIQDRLIDVLVYAALGFYIELREQSKEAS